MKAETQWQPPVSSSSLGSIFFKRKKLLIHQRMNEWVGINHREGIKKTKKAYYDIDATLTISTTGKWCRQGIPICKKRWKKMFRALKKNAFLSLSLAFLFSLTKLSQKRGWVYSSTTLWMHTINRNKKTEPLLPRQSSVKKQTG